VSFLGIPALLARLRARRRERAARAKSAPRPRGAARYLETIKTAIFALAIALFIRTFIVQAFRIPSGSMEDTLLIGDFLLVDKLTYGAKVPFTDRRLPGFRDPRRGDIIVFKDPRTNRDYIKRCIATDGETIEIKHNEVYIDGQVLPEPYKALKHVRGPVRDNFGPHTVQGGGLFMMGDNRNNSQDSRYWNDLDPGRVVGRAFVLYWSTDPDKAPRFVQRMSESWVKGFLQLFMGRPRLRRFGKWLAKDWSKTYQEEIVSSAAASSSGSDDPAGAARSGGSR
jgi:signal peptidase I